MKVLLIGQLPKEIGGNYTTGAANVVFELSKQHATEVVYYTFGTNISSSAASKASAYPNQYIGYRFKPFRILFNSFIHPLKTLHHWLHYHKVDHQSILRYAFYEDCIREAIKITQPDIIHVNSIDNVSPVRFALENNRIPILLTCHGIFYRGDVSDVIKRDRALGNIGLADAYSGLTQESLEEFESILGVAKERVTIIPNGVDCKKFYYSPDERLNLRKELEVNDGCVVFTTVASVQGRKGQLSFVKLLEKTTLDYQYWIIGGGPDVPIIESYIASHHLEGKVKLLGYKKSSELFKYYSAADIYAHVSTMEGQALCEIEASATGINTIINKKIAGTIPDLSNGNYFIIDLENPEVQELCDWVGQKRYDRHSVNSLDWSIIALKYAKWYNLVLDNWKV